MAIAASPQIIGRYAIHGKIASGGMASVHFGRLLGGAGFSRTVAIKRLHPHLAEDPDFLATLIDEARLAARIHHPNVVPTLDVVATDGELLLVMEYVRGEALSRLARVEIAAGGRVPLSVASAIVIGSLHGLHAAHEATNDQGEPLQLVHRDVSPQNILVGIDGLPRVIDFGVAKATGRLQTTREGTIKGKIAYMAPEQLASQPVTRAADIYAMGVVLWETLAGRRLFQADTEPELVRMVVAGALEPPSQYAEGISPELDALVMRAIAPDPDARFSTAREMADWLTRVLPPALPTDVGDWCVAVAGGALAKRGALLAEIESQSGSESLAAAAIESGIGRAPLAGAGHDPSSMPSQVSSVSMDAPQRSPPRAVWAVLAGLGAVGVLALAVAVWQLKASAVSRGAATSFGDDGAREPTHPSPSASARTSALLSAPPSEPASTVAPAEPAPSAVPAPTPPAVAPAPPSTTPRAARPASASSKGSSASCDPSFYFDSSGNKHFKPECFGH